MVDDRLKYYLEAGRYIELVKLPNRADFARYYRVVAREWLGDMPVVLVLDGADDPFGALAAGTAQVGFYEMRHLEPTVADRLFQIRYMIELWNQEDAAKRILDLDMMKNVRVNKENPPGHPLYGTDKQNESVDATGLNPGGKRAGAMNFLSNPYHFDIIDNETDANHPVDPEVETFPTGIDGSTQYPFEDNEDWLVNGFWPSLQVDNQSARELDYLVVHTIGMKYELRRLHPKELTAIEKGHIRPKTIQIGGVEIVTASRR